MYMGNVCVGSLALRGGGVALRGGGVALRGGGGVVISRKRIKIKKHFHFH